MAGWRNSNLEELLGGALESGSITEQHLQRLIDLEARENEYLDFKRSIYATTRGPRGEWSSEQEFAKDVTAFANGVGGVIAIGVDEREGVATALTPIEGASFAIEEQRLRFALANYCGPPARLDFVEVSSDRGAGYYMLVVVPPSRSSPHAVLAQPGDRRRTLRYAIRNGADVDWLSEHEVANRYSRRFLGIQERERREQTVLREGREALSRTTNTWVYVAVAPDYPNAGVLDRAAVADARNWLFNQQIESPLRSSLAVTGGPIAGPGRTTFTEHPYTDSDDAGDPRGTYIELYVDGHVFLAHELQEASDSGVNELHLSDLCVLLTDGSVRWAAKQIGAWGQASVHVGICSGTEGEPQLVSPLTLTRYRHGQLQRAGGTRKVLRKPYAARSIDLGEASSMRSRLEIAYWAVASLLQWFGVPEPATLTRDGGVVPEAWSSTWAGEVRQWMARHQIS